MKILAIAQSKGGSGKTTIALNLLAAAAETGLGAILIDADHHAAGSTVLLGFSPPERSLFAVLQHNVDPMVVARRIPEFNCLVLPGSYALSDLPADLPLNALSDCIQAIARDAGDAGDQDFQPDLVIIDCPGGDVVMNRMALYAADTVAVPMNFSALDLTANEMTVNLIAAVRDLRGGRPALAGMIPNRIQRGDSIARDLAFLVASRVPLLPTIPESNLIRRTGSAADLNRRVVVTSHPKSSAAERFRLLFKVLIGQLPWSRDDGLQDLGDQLNMAAGEFFPGLQQESELALWEAAA